MDGQTKISLIELAQKEQKNHKKFDNSSKSK